MRTTATRPREQSTSADWRCEAPKEGEEEGEEEEEEEEEGKEEVLSKFISALRMEEGTQKKERELAIMR